MGALADAYDKRNFSLQGVTGTPVVIAVIVMIGLSNKIAFAFLGAGTRSSVIGASKFVSNEAREDGEDN